MALADWTLEDDRYVLDGTHALSGSSALLARTGYPGSATVTWDQSATDSPTAAQLDTSAYTEFDDYVGFGAVFRYQDANDYYYVSFDRPTYTGLNIRLGKVEAGTATTIEMLTAVVETPINAWNGFRFLLWESSGSIVGRALVDTGSGWTQATDRDLYDSAPSFSGGGAVGFVFEQFQDQGTDYWVDDTKVYY